jgi:hypothetical protein
MGGDSRGEAIMKPGLITACLPKRTLPQICQ